MLYIQKRKTPNIIAEEAEKIKKTPGSGYAQLEVPENSKQLRILFEKMPKDEIRKALFFEQHGLCAYCMRRITGVREDTRIEHYKALSTDKEAALDYQNFLGVCYGGEKEDSNNECLCCDAARGEKELTINPWNKRQMEAIGYYRDTGEIYVLQNVGLGMELQQALQKDIDEKLHLNGEKDLKGRIIWDTRSKLVAHRRAICDSVYSQFARWGRKGVLTADFLRDKIEKLEEKLKNDETADEYIGVRLYFYKREEKRLRRREGRPYTGNSRKTGRV